MVSLLDVAPSPWPMLPDVTATDVVHAIAVLTIALVVIRGLQAMAEHYFPDSEAVVAGRFLYGGT